MRMTEMPMTETGDVQAVGNEQRFLALPFWSLRHSDFEFVSDFDIRISDFAAGTRSTVGLRAKPALGHLWGNT